MRGAALLDSAFESAVHPATARALAGGRVPSCPDSTCFRALSLPIWRGIFDDQVEHDLARSTISSNQRQAARRAANRDPRCPPDRPRSPTLGRRHFRANPRPIGQRGYLSSLQSCAYILSRCLTVRHAPGQRVRPAARGNSGDREGPLRDFSSCWSASEGDPFGNQEIRAAVPNTQAPKTRRVQNRGARCDGDSPSSFKVQQCHGVLHTYPPPGT